MYMHSYFTDMLHCIGTKDDEGNIQQQEQQYHLEHPLQSISTVESKVASSPLAPVHTEEPEWLMI